MPSPSSVPPPSSPDSAESRRPIDVCRHSGCSTHSASPSPCSSLCPHHCRSRTYRRKYTRGNVNRSAEFYTPRNVSSRRRGRASPTAPARTNVLSRVTLLSTVEFVCRQAGHIRRLGDSCKEHSRRERIRERTGSRADPGQRTREPDRVASIVFNREATIVFRRGIFLPFFFDIAGIGCRRIKESCRGSR